MAVAGSTPRVAAGYAPEVESAEEARAMATVAPEVAAMEATR